uniref:Uncharacterized protein n=1 Tax=Panagrolaimus sp. ES5 TaxID=591445 RepID=A0AC34FJS1_9BILA
MALHVLGFLYIIIFAEELDAPTLENDNEGIIIVPLTSTISSHFTQVFDFIKSYRNKPCFKYLIFVLISISIEMLFNSGIDDILFSYLRYKLSWSDKPYGWYNGLGNAVSSITVIFLYPYLHRLCHINDVMLAVFGFTGKIILLLMFVSLFSNWWAYLALIPTALTRFTLTGLRASSSNFVEFTEQEMPEYGGGGAGAGDGFSVSGYGGGGSFVLLISGALLKLLFVGCDGNSCGA